MRRSENAELLALICAVLLSTPLGAGKPSTQKLVERVRTVLDVDVPRAGAILGRSQWFARQRVGTGSRARTHWSLSPEGREELLAQLEDALCADTPMMGVGKRFYVKKAQSSL